jgi:hypothetical protein
MLVPGQSVCSIDELVVLDSRLDIETSAV